MKPVRVGILGLGTVGGGTLTVLQRNAAEIARRAGRDIVPVMAAVRDMARAREKFADTSVEMTVDPFALVRHPDVDIVVEAMGGETLARELILAAIAAGKHVVTANKALIARHGTAIFAAAQQQGVTVAFEAAVGGGIPIIKAIREGLTANRIEWIAGIINGTTNFILTQMRDQGSSFTDALQLAQEKGYAEADPTFDVEGIDAAHKLTILSALSFGIPMQFDKAHIEGISHLTRDDVRYAEQLGYRIKLLGITRRTSAGIELRVHPALIPAKRLIANVDGSMNAILVKGDAVGVTLYYGAGAGAEPTASSIVADLVDVTRMHTADPHHRVPHLAFQPENLSSEPILPMGEVRTRYYLRLPAKDETGVLAEVTRILADTGISIEAMVQQESAAGNGLVDIVMLTHQCLEKHIDAAILAIAELPALVGDVARIRLETLAG